MMASSIRRHGPEPIVISMSVSPTSRFIDCVRHTRDVFLFDLMYERSRVSMFRHHFSQMLQPAPRSASTATIRNWGVVRCSRSHSAAIFTDGGTGSEAQADQRKEISDEQYWRTRTRTPFPAGKTRAAQASLPRQLRSSVPLCRGNVRPLANWIKTGMKQHVDCCKAICRRRTGLPTEAL